MKDSASTSITSTLAMPVMWPCPGRPQCGKSFLYNQAYKAHLLACKDAKRKRVKAVTAGLNSVLALIWNAENSEWGNITICRSGNQNLKETVVLESV